MDAPIPHLGEILALSTAMVWAFAVILFKRSGETVGPMALNLFKNTFAMVLIPPTMLVFGMEIFRSVPINDYLWMFASGALGIGVADTLFFKSLNLLGASRSAIVDCLYSPFIIAISIPWLGESLTLLQLIGVLFIVSAVLVVGWEKETGNITRGQLILGIVLGALSQALMGVGVVMIKELLERSPLFWSIEMRLVGAAIILGPVLYFDKRRHAILVSFTRPANLKFMLPGAFLGTYIALMLWLGGMKYTQASTASALNQMSNVFIFIFAALLLKERITLPRLVGIAMGFAGVYMVTGEKLLWTAGILPKLHQFVSSSGVF